MINKEFQETGWLRLKHDVDRKLWADAARLAALDAVADPANAHWMQCEGTWFLGVDVLPNDAQGRVNGVSLDRATIDLLTEFFGPLPPFHPAQVSVTYPGYPKPRDGESEVAFGYRLRRDAAHVDGLRLDRASGTRCCEEYHGFVLGLPLVETTADASPMVLWEGSHTIMKAALQDALAPYPREQWHAVDISSHYKAARRHVFAECKRVEVAARPGEAYVLHRHLLHGVAPWAAEAKAPPEGRMVAYFRPEWPEGITRWLAE